jgi:hypothetical protein
MIGFQYTIPAVQIKYNGVTYRSVLEATWAAFFDAVGWKYDYEPKRYGDWLVDFVIHGHKDIPVEVKPVTVLPGEVAEKIDECVPAIPPGDPASLLDKTELIQSEDEDQEVLILGESPIFDAGYLGWIREGGWWDKAAFGFWLDGKGMLGFCHNLQNYYDRISGGYDGGCHGNHPAVEHVNDYVRRMWRLAENRISEVRKNEEKDRALLPKICENCFAFCFAFSSNEFNPEIWKSLGQCRFNPPIVSGKEMRAWPIVKADDWCCCFKVRK